MWPFKRRLPCVYLVDTYGDGRESRRTMPVETLSNGDHVVRKHGDDALVLQSDGSIVGAVHTRWAVIDDIPGLTDDTITPEKLAQMCVREVGQLEDRIQELKDHLERIIDAAEALRDAKSGVKLRQAESLLASVVGRAENDMDRE